MLSRSKGMPSRREGPSSTWDMVYRETFLQTHMHLHQQRPEQDQDLRRQSGPSAKDSVIFSGGDSSKNYGADQQ